MDGWMEIRKTPHTKDRALDVTRCGWWAWTWLTLFKANKDDGLKGRGRMYGRNVTQCHYQLTGAANKANRANEHMANFKSKSVRIFVCACQKAGLDFQRKKAICFLEKKGPCCKTNFGKWFSPRSQMYMAGNFRHRRFSELRVGDGTQHC